MDRLIWTPDQGLPDGARARDWLREPTRRERYRWLKFRHPNGRWRLRENEWGDLEWGLITPPTLISYTEVAYNAGGTSRASASISWQAGDIVAVIAGVEDSTLPGVPTATGLAFTTQKSNNAASTCATLLSAASPVGSGSSAVTMTLSSGAKNWGFSVWVYRGSDGIGTSSEGHTTAKTVSQTNSAADSAVVWGGFDFGANAVTNNNITPTPTNTDERAAVGAAYTVYVADLTDQTSAGSVAYGVSGAGTVGAFSKVVLEIKGAASTPPTDAQISPAISQSYQNVVIGRVDAKGTDDARDRDSRGRRGGWTPYFPRRVVYVLVRDAAIGPRVSRRADVH